MYWPQIPDNQYKLLVASGSLAPPNIDKIYLNAKDLYQLLINKDKDVSMKHFKDPKTFIQYSNDIKIARKSTEEFNPGKEKKVLIVSGKMIADNISSKKFHQVVIELFKYFFNCNYTVILSCTKRYKTKHRTFSSWRFQKRERFNKVLLIIHLIVTHVATIQKFYCRIMFIFSHWHYNSSIK